MFNWHKKTDQKTESIKDENKIELQETSSNAITTTVEVVAVEQPIKDNTTLSLPKEEQTPPLTYKENKALKKSNYEKIAEKFNTSYVMKNKKTGQVVEIRAASSFHACNIIGWKPNKVVILSETKVESTSLGQKSEET